ncbi:hypothetical protein [Plasticicumulans acidivorans]|uniref:Uncharacterized protein n=1 Tax=Plasticicumulans acidivorans TaxID=886464 RepID=A0A317MXR1_9GAMM|nr:hypothetical protein [Plasticicumulans acidivorans]PWV64430.1 hypothetical protein C7443_10279 [Plasticicumulans acidivorans]
MSVVFSIVRTPQPIGRAEFEQAARRDAQLRVDADGSVYVRRAGGLEAPLYWEDGEIYTDVPESDVLAVMIALAATLGGRLRDESLTSWRTLDAGYVHADDAATLAARQSAQQRWQRKRRLRGGLKLAAVLLLAVVAIALRHPALWPTPLTDPASAFALPAAWRAALGDRRPALLLVPADDFSESYAAHLGDRLAELSALPVKTTLGVGLGPLQPLADSTQFDSTELVAAAAPAIARLRAQYGEVPVLLLTQRDINTAERSLRYRFAQHYLGPRISVISVARMLPGRFVGRASDELIEARLLKFLLRSVGQQVYRLPRDTDIDSVMYAPIMGLADLDRMGLQLPPPR